MQWKVAVLDDYAALFEQSDAVRILEAHDVTVFSEPCESEAALVSRLQPFDAVLLTQQRTALTGKVLEALPRLKLIAQTGTHRSHIDMDVCERRNIAVRFSGKGNPNATIELTWALILAASRNVIHESNALRAGRWQSRPGRILAGRTLGIAGFGTIGAGVATIGAAMGMHVLAHGREGSLSRARAAGYEATPDKAVLFARSDVLSIHLRENADTIGSITADDLAAMKRDALLVNSSRASLIAPGVLLRALELGRPGAAAIDVFENEPVMDAADPLLKLPQVVATPHLGYAVRDQLLAYFVAAAQEIHTHTTT